ncbi:FhaA domain-containing protein [Streptomyces sp. NPDC056600]|uniref:FhaA domain-containing protein n=1 Tax=Streptomyces sp. NPDC056600 TaxID=3345874 RepID=UPI0036C0260B
MDKIERSFETMVNGAFAKVFKSAVQPVEYIGALKRECDINARIWDRDCVIVPNCFVIELNPGDHEVQSSCLVMLGEELVHKLREYAEQQHYSFVGPLKVQLQRTQRLKAGRFRVRSRIEVPPDVQRALQANERYHTTYAMSAVMGKERGPAWQPPPHVVREEKRVLTVEQFISLGLTFTQDGMLARVYPPSAPTGSVKPPPRLLESGTDHTGVAVMAGAGPEPRALPPAYGIPPALPPAHGVRPALVPADVGRTARRGREAGRRHLANPPEPWGGRLTTGGPPVPPVALDGPPRADAARLRSGRRTLPPAGEQGRRHAADPVPDRSPTPAKGPTVTNDRDASGGSPTPDGRPEGSDGADLVPTPAQAPAEEHPNGVGQAPPPPGGAQQHHAAPVAHGIGPGIGPGGGPGGGPGAGPGVEHPPPPPHAPQVGWGGYAPPHGAPGMPQSYGPQAHYGQAHWPAPDPGARAGVLGLSAAVELSSDRLLRKRAGERRGLNRLRIGGRKAEREREQKLAVLRTPVTQCHKIAVISLKGGVGKTTTTTALGATLATERQDRVVAIDANPDAGTLSRRVRCGTNATIRDLVAEIPNIDNYMAVRRFTSQSPSGLEILANEADPALSTAFSEEDYRKVIGCLGQHYPIVLTDSGTGLLHSAMRGILDHADQLILVATPSVDGATSASTTLDWLNAHGYEDLVHRSITVISEARRKSRNVRVDDVVHHFHARCRGVVIVPFDEHLAAGSEVDLEQLKSRTREAYFDLATLVAADFPRTQPEPVSWGASYPHAGYNAASMFTAPAWG